MATEITKIGAKILINGVEYRVSRFQLTANRRVIGTHKLSFVVEVERPVLFQDQIDKERTRK